MLRDRVKPEKLAFARKMRKAPTPAERVLWSFLRKQQLGPRFRRQAVMFGWIVDFYCPFYNLVVEVDGSIHKASQAKDRFRDSTLAKHGYKTIRFENDEVLDDPRKVVEQIKKVLVERSETISNGMLK